MQKEEKIKQICTRIFRHRSTPLFCRHFPSLQHQWSSAGGAGVLPGAGWGVGNRIPQKELNPKLNLKLLRRIPGVGEGLLEVPAALSHHGSLLINRDGFKASAGNSFWRNGWSTQVCLVSKKGHRVKRIVVKASIRYYFASVCFVCHLLGIYKVTTFSMREKKKHL